MLRGVLCPAPVCWIITEREGNRVSSLKNDSAVLAGKQRTDSKHQRLWLKIVQRRYIYLMLLPVLLYFLVFHYFPMIGILIAFKDYSVKYTFWENIFHTPWVGFKHFISFFESFYFQRVFWNTVIINLYGLLFTFPAPILLALLLNEVKNMRFKKTVQSITYMPHFISMVVIAGLVIDFTSSTGVINTILNLFGVEKIQFLIEPEWFRTVYIISAIWQEIGWGSIIYLAALAGIDAELYEAAVIDGAGRWKQMTSVTIPCITPTIIILLILKIGQMMNVGVEKILLLYRPTTYETADVISSYVYRRGMIEMQYSFSTAVGLFNSIINFTLLVSANQFSKKFSETSLW